ncbi:hypothetical protein BP5796_09443 [Coleophoma crateriformis]|uniref:Aspartokinase n=1 Tax=Coleophoma crateriformis TaxID=565419 RepID=A0A3D8QYR0_9HELO|nr:hypothetical protein BP5796_09443 [Coleophoma crateriformis]
MPAILPSPPVRKPWIVQKYGGTSLGNLLETITITIIPQYLETHNVGVVCSAISGTSKALGTTALLLHAVKSALGGDQSQLDATIEKIRDEHIKAIKEIRIGVRCKVQASICDALQADIIRECNELNAFLNAAQGIPAKLVSLLDIVASVYGNDLNTQRQAYEGLGSKFYDGLVQEIGRKLRACEVEGTVPIITGFFGRLPESMLKSVGRGYSDFCAAMCALGVEAVELQIWKDVDGIFTADPRKIPSARLLSTITLEEAAELTYYGSEVIHPLTMEQIRKANIPLRLKNVKNPGGRGTIIYPSDDSSSGTSSDTPSPVSSTESLLQDTSIAGFMSANGYYGKGRHRRSPTALTAKDSMILLNIQSNRHVKSHGFLARVFGSLDELNVVADLVTTSEQSVSLAISSISRPEEEKRLFISLERFGKVEVRRDVSIVSVIGHKMRNMVGISGEILSKLAQAGINVYLIAQGASEINISCVVQSSDAPEAMQTIHTNVLGIPQHAEHAPIAQNSIMKGPWLF